MAHREHSARPLRLAFVADAVAPWNTGGKEKRHHELMVRLARRGFEVTVYTMKWWEGPRTVRNNGLTYTALCPKLPLYAGHRRSIRQALVFALGCLSMLWRRFDVLEVDAIPFLPLLPMRLIATLRRRPMVTTWHEFWGRDYWVAYLGAPGRLAAAVEQGTMRLPTEIIAVSAGTADRLRAAGRSRGVHVIPNGIEATTGALASTAASLERSREEGAPARLLCVGRLLGHKRVHLALDALALLRERGVSARLEVIGEGPELERLRAQATRLGLDDATVFTPFLESHGDVLAALGQADVLVFPSVREGFGMVALEAMSVGTPVVTADHPDNFARHLVTAGVNGELAADDGGALADALERALVRRAELVRGALETAACYDWEDLADQTAEVYREASKRPALRS